MSIIIENNYVMNISATLDKFKVVEFGSRYNCRCPICGDSKKSELKARFHIFAAQDKDILMVNCFNCGYSTSFQHFLKVYYYEEYTALRAEIFKARGIREFAPKQIKKYKVEDIFNSNYQQMYKDIIINQQRIISLSKLSNEHKAKTYLLARKLPKDKINLLFYCSNYKNFIKSVMTPEQIGNRKVPADERIVIVLKSIDGEIIGFQGRSLDPSCDLRYCTMMLSKSYPKFAGLENIDKKSDRPIFVTEGFFDSLFIDGAISVNGGDINALSDIADCDGISKERFVVVLDNEPRSKDTRNRSKDTRNRLAKAISKGFKVVIWSGINPSYKDINDMMIWNIFENKQQLLEFLLNNVHSNGTALVKKAQWEKR